MSRRLLSAFSLAAIAGCNSSVPQISEPERLCNNRLAWAATAADTAAALAWEWDGLIWKTPCSAIISRTPRRATP